MENLKTLSLIIGCFFLIASCSQDNDDTTPTDGYYMKFDLDGKTILFTGTTAYSFNASEEGQSYAYSLNGGDDDSGFTINIGTPGELKKGDNFNGERLYSEIPEVYIAYSEPNDTKYTYGSWVTDPYEPIALPCSVTILEVTDENIKGRFSGEMRKHENEDKITVTNGEFNVKRTILGTK